MQKLSLLILLLGLTFCYTAPGASYQALDVAEAQSSPEIQNLIQFGLQAIVQNGVQKGFFTESDFALVQINSIYEEIGDGNNYQFDCNFQDSNGIKIAAKFEVHQDLASNSQSLISFSYNVSYPSTSVTDPDAEDNVEEAQVGDGVEGEVEFPEESQVEGDDEGDGIGIDIPEDNTPDNSTEPAVPENEFKDITEEEFDNSTQLNSVFQFGFAQVVEYGIKDSSIPNTNFTFAVITALAKKTVENGELYKFSCKATDRKGVEINMNFQVLQAVQSYSYNAKVVANDTNTTEPTNPAEPPTNSTNNETQPLENEEVQRALNFGVEQVLESGKKKGKVPEGNYSITEVVAVSWKNVTNGVNYSFDVRLVNEKKTVFITTNFTVNLRDSNKKIALYSYYLKISSKEPKPSNNNNSTNPTPNPPVPEDNNTNAPNNTNPDPNSYVELDAATIEQDSVIQSVLAFGIDEVLKLGIKQGRIPNTPYTTSEVVSVSKKVVKDGESYKCVVNLVNEQGVRVNANFTILYGPQAKNMAMTAFSYQAENISAI